jgi:crotonobetainyl-CoA:carnitine CoA-transferase CaiB-like acyl-CoA transferase
MSSVRKVAKVIGLAKYDDGKFDSNNIIENRDQIRWDFNAVFKTKTTNEWLELLLADDVWCSQVNSFVEMVEDPQIKHNKMIVEYEHPTVGKVKTTGFPVSFSDTPQKIEKPAPLLNEHAAEILREYCNYSKEEIEAFENNYKN